MDSKVKKTKQIVQMSMSLARLDSLARIVANSSLSDSDYEMTLKEVRDCADKIGLTLQAFFNR